MTEQSILDRIVALLAKAESSEFEAEAAAYMAKAQELMIKHAVDESALTPAERESIIAKTFPLPAANAERLIWAAAAKAAGVQYYTSNSKLGNLVGYPSDLAFAQMLAASLIIQRESALRKAIRPEWESARSFNFSFRIAFASRVYHRLTESKRAATAAATEPGTALVLRNRDAEVAQHVRRIAPGLRSTSVSGGRSRGGHAAGTAAGNSADVSGGRNNLGGTGRARISA